MNFQTDNSNWKFILIYHMPIMWNKSYNNLVNMLGKPQLWLFCSAFKISLENSRESKEFDPSPLDNDLCSTL